MEINLPLLMNSFLFQVWDANIYARVYTAGHDANLLAVRVRLITQWSSEAADYIAVTLNKLLSICIGKERMCLGVCLLHF